MINKEKIIPDFTLMDEGIPIMILDAKYKKGWGDTYSDLKRIEEKA